MLGSGGLASAQDGEEWSASRPVAPSRGDTHWVGLRASLGGIDKRKISCLCRELNSVRPAHSLSATLIELPMFLESQNKQLKGFVTQ
jgi:hypothetical protein